MTGKTTINVLAALPIALLAGLLFESTIKSMKDADHYRAIAERETILRPFRERVDAAYHDWFVCTADYGRRNWVTPIDPCAKEKAAFERSRDEAHRAEKNWPFPERGSP